MDKQKDHRHRCIAIINGTHLGLLEEPGGSEDMDISVPSVPLHLIHSFYDSFMEIQSSNCVIEPLESNDPNFDGDPIAEVIIPRHHFHRNATNKDGDFSLWQYPCEREAESAAVGNNIEIHVTRDTTETDQRGFYSLYLVKDSIAPLPDTPILKIQSAGYLICEMSNSNGNEQILFLPPHLQEIFSPSKSVSDHKTILSQIIKQCTLVDGIHMFCHSANTLSISRNGGTKRVRFCNVDTEKSVKTTSPKPSLSSLSPSRNAGTGTEKNIEALPENKWQKALRTAVRKRYNRAISLEKKQHQIIQIKKQLNLQSRRILRNTSITPNSTRYHTKHIADRMKIAQIRYRVEPVTGMSNSSSVQLHMEVDIAMDSTHNHGPFLHNLHLSLSPKTKENQSLSVSTKSGVIPTMRVGNCFRISALVTISGISVTSLPTDNTCAQLLLSAFFSYVPGCTGISKKGDIKSIVLSLISIPFESMIFKSNPSLTLNSNVEQRKPTAVFDYRAPCSLSIDVSASISNKILDDWQAITDSFNSKCMLGNRVECRFDRQRVRVELSVFASSPEHRLCLLKGFMGFMPKESQIVETTAGALQRGGSNLVKGILKELTLIQHVSSSGSGGVAELLQTQFENDGLASHLCDV